MDPSTREALLQLNRRFYTQVAPYFDATRQGWTPGLLSILPYFRTEKKEKLTVLDVGCGNGRFARLLEQQDIIGTYTGVDGNEQLLDLARETTAPLKGVMCSFLQADLAEDDWTNPLRGNRYDIVLSTATIQHLPGYELRRRVMTDFYSLAAGTVILSFWQFLSSPRFRSKLVDPRRIALDPQEFEPGDGLLPWRQGVEAIRYVHQVDENELEQLTTETGFTIQKTFRADGKEGNLNLYAVLTPASAGSTQQTSTPAPNP